MNIKKIFGIILVSTLLWSCGSQFNRSKYDRYMWNRSSGKDVTDKSMTDEVKSNSSLKLEETAKTEIKLDGIENTDAGLISERNVSNLDLHVLDDKKSKGEFESDLNNYQSVTELPKDEKSLAVKAVKKRAAKKLASNGDSDLGSILMIILLVILIILVFSLLNTLLGGALSTILGIVLLVLLIYFILKLLGAI